MHHSKVQLSFAGQAPDNLLAFLDGRLPQDLEVHNAETPKKKRKTNRGSSAKVTPFAEYPEEYLTLARVEVSIAFTKGPAESYPSPGSEPSNNDLGVVLEAFTQPRFGAYQCCLSTKYGTILFDDIVLAELPSRTSRVLQQAILLSRPRKNFDAWSTFTISKSLRFDHDASLTILDLCVRIRVPDSRTLYPNVSSMRKGDPFETCCGLKKTSKAERKSRWSPRDFYDNVHVPSNKDVPYLSPIEELECTLYPFQKRAVQWLLRREGVLGTHNPVRNDERLACGFLRTTDADGKDCFFSQSLGIITTNQSMVRGAGVINGGILAEEMGLGKTVEITALICSHRQSWLQDQASSNLNSLPNCPATLIVTPPAILQQWKSELKALAPRLKVSTYDGLRVEASNGDQDSLKTRFCQHDVILTTYHVLAKEIHYAEAPERGLRHRKRYEKRLSPLTHLLWWRVVLDEAQMVEGGVSNASRVAGLIPRINAWCVSGTPVRRDARDLLSLLSFLRYEPYGYLPHTYWDRLVTDYKHIFKQIFQDIALRHSKDQVKKDIQLPPQKRVVITLPFSQIEDQHYSMMLNQMAEECGLDARGVPLAEDWDPNDPAVIESMRDWLTRLRQTCLHPEVGGRNRKALGNGKGPLRTVNEVLEVMIEQNDTAARSEERALLLSQIRKGQILEHAEQSEDALQLWKITLEETQVIVQDCRDQLAAQINRLKLNEESAEHNEKYDIEAVTATRTGPHRQRLRAALEIEHMCAFFVANAYYQIKTDENLTKPDSTKYQELEKMEGTNYEKAKILRKELLRETNSKAGVFIARINEKTKGHSFVQVPFTPPFHNHGGIESRNHFGKIDGLIAVMEAQASQLDEWRRKTKELLTSTLMDEEENEIKGDEYETSTKHQDEVYVYVDVLRAIVSDRHDILTGQDNQLIEHEMTLALREARDGKGHSPQLLQQLLKVRQKLKPSKNLGSIRGLISEMRELKTTLRGAVERGNSRAAAELLIINGALGKLNQIFIEQTKAVTALDREVELFRDTMNSRLEYYRQLQQISDTVAPYEENMSEEARCTVLSEKQVSESRLKARISTLKSKGRYLIHLRDDSADLEAQRLCIICQQPFEIGILTTCGHSYCVECLRLWWGAHRNCPTCKKHLSRNDLHQITYKPQELTMHEESLPKEKEVNLAGGEESSIYSSIHGAILNQIKNIDLDGSFGTKIDTLGRHLLWIREHDPGAKSIVFSQYKDFLDVLARAFAQYKIAFTGIDRKDGIQKFKNDPGMECFFLHAKAHSSGLNLVNATHVFLCEPLINTAIELQAIARVHRIGQHQPTTVWMYLIDGTVEQSICDISVQRRLAHMGQSGTKDGKDVNGIELENKIEAANTFELEEAPLSNLLTKGPGDGEVVLEDDLWNCLFKTGQASRASQAVEREVARYLGADAAEARRDEVESVAPGDL